MNSEHFLDRQIIRVFFNGTAMGHPWHLNGQDLIDERQCGNGLAISIRSIDGACHDLSRRCYEVIWTGLVVERRNFEPGIRGVTNIYFVP